jgi:methyl-accepting chemotaxis protein
VTQTTAASAEESAAAAQELSAQSDLLKDLVRQLNEIIGAAAHEQETAAHSGFRFRGLPA